MTAQLTAYTKSSSIDSLYYDEWRSIREGNSAAPLGHSWPGTGEDELEESCAGVKDAVATYNYSYMHQ